VSSRSADHPLLSARFRVEIEGLQSTGATEVLLPEARITGARSEAPAVHYGSLTLRRGMTTSGEWYRWWDVARTSAAGARKTVTVVLMDAHGADANCWTFSEAQPTGYFVSQLDALNGGVLVESLELSIAGFTMAFGDKPAAR
jgi:phage tail-like protein